MNKAPKERYTITLECPEHPLPGIQRLRAFLKLALRSAGLRCVKIEPEFDQKENPNV
ncbi:hypothetical protein OAL44_01100 [Planctomycetaceae bacterium]|nr:hypothetical protein [Planctomycetaceae bacterium]MDC0307710.1 hypothetical protein [Planctomycetaceae bacterium]